MADDVIGLETLEKAGSIGGIDISPDGRTIVFAATTSGVPQIFTLDLNGGEPVQITHGTEQSVRPAWSPRGDLIAFLQDVGGDENHGIHVMAPDGSGHRVITDKPGYLHEGISWSRDGERILFSSNRDGQFDIYYADVSTGGVHRVTNYPSVHHGGRFSPDGTRIAFASNRTKLPSNWDTFVINIDGTGERRLTEHEGEADEMSYYAGQACEWSPDGSRVLTSSSARGNYDIMAIDVETLEREWIADSSWDEAGGRWSPDGKQIAYTVNDDCNIALHVKDLASGDVRSVSQREGISGAGGGRSGGGSYRWTPDGRSLVYPYSSSTVSGSIWIADADGGEPRCLYSMMPPDIDPASLVPAEVVHWESDGLRISGLLYRPRNTLGPVPAVIMPHGGPTGQSTNSWTPGFSPLIQHLVSKGYAVLEPNFRGSTGYGTRFMWLNRHDWGGGDLRDVLAGVEYLRREGIADRFGIFGASFGGFMTMTAITKAPEVWSAAANLFGVVNLFTSYASAREDMKQFVIRNMGTPDEHPELYRERSPLNFVDNIRCPLLILHGERDSRVRLEEAEQIRDSMEAAGKPYELVVYEHEGHGFQRRENRLDYQRRVAEFFDRYLARTPVVSG